MEASSAASSSRHIIEPASGWSFPDLRELWRNRDLVYFLARRDLAIRYRQSVVGTFWVVLQPILLAAVFSFFFGHLQKVDSYQDIPYPLLAVSGMVMWLFLSNAIINSTTSTVTSSELISKLYFPRLAIPLAAILPWVVDFFVAFAVVVVVAAAYGFFPGPEMLSLPLIVVFAFVCSAGIGLWTSALNTRFRDVQHLVSFGVLLGLFTAPIIYPITLIPENLQVIYSINPTVGVLEAYRWMLLGATPEVPISIVMSAVMSSVLLVTGLVFYRRAEQDFADIL